MFREFLISTVAMLKVFVWDPIKKAAKAIWNMSFGPCCDNPNLEFNEIPGASMHRCLNCGATRVHQSGRGF